jgi:hypothetical protein
MKTADMIEDYKMVQRLNDELTANPPTPDQIDSDPRVASFIEYYLRSGLGANTIGGFGKMMDWIKENSPQKYRPSARTRKHQRERNWLQRVQ